MYFTVVIPSGKFYDIWMNGIIVALYGNFLETRYVDTELEQSGEIKKGGCSEERNWWSSFCYPFEDVERRGYNWPTNVCKGLVKSNTTIYRWQCITTS